MRTWIACGVMLLCGCAPEGSTDKADPYSLYRNSNIDGTIRVHWATFNAQESDPSYNANNCSMAARLLNANMAASAEAELKVPHPGVGFWCEPGAYSEKGAVPSRFEAAFPTHVN